MAIQQRLSERTLKQFYQEKHFRLYKFNIKTSLTYLKLIDIFQLFINKAFSYFYEKCMYIY